jgi:hypothetical protein
MLPMPIGRFLLACLLAVGSIFSLLRDLQDEAGEPAELSRDLLYHPARRIARADGAWVFTASRFEYRFDPATGEWRVLPRPHDASLQRSDSLESFFSERLGSSFEFAAEVKEGKAALRLRRTGDSPEVIQLTLWTREQLAVLWDVRPSEINPSPDENHAGARYQIAEPEVAAVADDGTYLWLAIRFYDGEGNLGIGSVVRVTPQPLAARVFQPDEVARSSVSRIAAAPGVSSVWLGTLRLSEGFVQSAQGLVRLNPENGAARSYLPENSQILGRMVTALYLTAEALWVASDEGICRVTLPEESFACWRITPMVETTAPLPLSNRPGAPPGGKLPPGRHEVLWANAGFLAVATPDSFDGWVEADDLEEWEHRRFDRSPYLLENISAEGVGVMRVLARPGADPMGAALLYRAPLQRIGAPDSQGWQRVRVHAGWIPHGNLAVVPAISPAR